jgi:S-formylglutathione hydrolase
MIKAGAQRYAAEHGIMLVAPDTGPRDTGIAEAVQEWDFGEGAGFYLDATEEPYRERFRMESYLIRELVPLVQSNFAVLPERVGVFGHSMGGHGALVMALRHPQVFRSVSAFAPIAAPSRCPWGEKAFSRYLGQNREAWLQYDASELMKKRHTPFPDGIWIDQGLEDKFLQEQLKPEAFEAACAQASQPLTLRRHPGYDHGYYFISSFMADHLAFHARILSR